MVPLRFKCDNALCLLVFLCIIGLSLQGCLEYLHNSSLFLNFSSEQYIRLEKGSLNLNRTELVNLSMKHWCCQEKQHQCKILHSCFKTIPDCNELYKQREKYPQEMEMVSTLQLYCMVNNVKNNTHSTECMEGERFYVCTLKPTETPTPSFHNKTTKEAAATTEAATTAAATTCSPSPAHILSSDSYKRDQGFIASNVILAFLLVLLIVSNAAWCQNFQRQRRIHQLWKLEHECACTDNGSSHLLQGSTYHLDRRLQDRDERNHNDPGLTQ